LVNSK